MPTTRFLLIYTLLTLTSFMVAFELGLKLTSASGTVSTAVDATLPAFYQPMLVAVLCTLALFPLLARIAQRTNTQTVNSNSLDSAAKKAASLATASKASDNAAALQQKPGPTPPSKSRADTYLDQAHTLVLVLNPEGRVEYLNQHGYRLLGYPRESLQGIDWLKFCVPADQHDRVRHALHQYRQRHQLSPMYVEHPVLTAEGEQRLIAWNCNSVTIDDGSRQLLCSGLDITENRQTQESLLKLSCAVEQSSTSVLIFDREGRIEYVNPAFSAMSGFKAIEVIGRKPSFLEGPDTNRRTLVELRTTIARGENWQGEVCYRKRDGQSFWARSRVSPIKDEEGQINHYVSVTEDITVQHQHQQQIERMAYQDQLTLLANRRGFRQQLKQALAQCQEQQRSLTLFFINLDHFKRINDSLGQSAGDMLLCRIATMLKQEISRGDLVARHSSDEFTLALHDLNHEQAAQFGRRINRLIRQPVTLINGDSRRENRLMTASIGIASFPDNSCTASELVKFAELAMQRVKSNDRNGYRFFSSEMQDELEADLFLEQELQRALQNDEFELYYQPQVDLTLGRVTGMEALLRWQHPERGLISPDQFISVAERSGLIIPLGQHVLRKACASYRVLDLLGLGHLRIAINLSALQFRDPLFPRTFQQILIENRVDASRIELELTESMLMTNIEEAILILGQLKKLGATLAIDDFGTGYSSLSYLKQLPVDIIKVDRCFVKDIPSSQSDMEITAAVIAMAHKLKRKVVAEGVETEQQERFLRDNDCDYLQGYRYSPPVPESELTALIARIDQQLDNRPGNCVQLEFDS